MCMMLGNSRLLRGARKRIEGERLAAETAVQDESEAIAAAILAAKDDDKAGAVPPRRRGAGDRAPAHAQPHRHALPLA